MTRRASTPCCGSSYVLPILHGDRLIGRIDPAMDQAQGRLTINAIYAQAGAPATRKAGQTIANAIEKLGAFLGATDIVYNRRVPAIWKRALNHSELMPHELQNVTRGRIGLQIESQPVQLIRLQQQDLHRLIGSAGQ